MWIIYCLHGCEKWQMDQVDEDNVVSMWCGWVCGCVCACVCPCTSCALTVLHCNISAGKDIGALLSNIGSAAASAPAAGSGGAGTSGSAPAQEEEKKEEKAAEPESESDEDMGFGEST